jgi:BCD family chlorophyll transporter-like MFS transporter
VFILGLSNGVYAVAAIGSMMSLVGSTRNSREGLRMGLWGAAQAIAFGVGGFAGMLASDLARFVIGVSSIAYATVFAAEATLFLFSALLASRVYAHDNRSATGRYAGIAEFPRHEPESIMSAGLETSSISANLAHPTGIASQ